MISARWTATLLSLCTIACPTASRAAEKPEAGTQSEAALDQKITKKLDLEYLLYLPKDYGKDANKQWPLVVFLHGAGERGDDLEKVKIHGPPKLAANGKQFPFILISPQCPKDGWWPSQPIPDLIDEAEKRYAVDPDRIYLTGLSMGGYGTWAFASQQPKRYAAIAPICGGGTPYLMRGLKHLPVWAFHGAKDTAVPLVESERLVEALKRAGNEQVKFTIYPEAGHDSWTASYNNEELYEWLLSHERGK